MKKYKVCVYAICKNEEKFVERWVNSMKEADLIVVADTGSTDNTVKKLKEMGVKVTSINITPWRFDKARNESLKLVPDDIDICVCTDLDEVFLSGWRDKVEACWDEGVTRLRYNYNWNFDEYGNPATSFYINKIHGRHEYKWTHPVHEVLTYIGDNKENEKTCDNILLNHYADNSKSRSSYLPLLEMSVLEDPEDDRNMHYLGREYMFYHKWNESIDTLIKHLKMPKATWKPERCASMRFIARSYIGLNRLEEASMWYDKAILEEPNLREAYVEKAYLEYMKENYNNSYDLLNKALKIPNKSNSYINEEFCWNYFIYDLMSVNAYAIGKKQEAIKYCEIANKLNPNNERIKNNLEIMKN
ncbi:MAG: glycosyltransferase [Bacilli bacterium]|nr:glycosyltransferase [Bacilli bacterium]